MARPQLTIQQQLSRCRTNLSLERVKTRRYKKQLEEEKKFNNLLMEENAQLHRKLIEFDFYSKEEK